jgi:hypothetical protein
VASGVDELLLVKTDRAIRTEDLLGGVEEGAASSREEDTAVAEESESRTTEEALMLMEKLAGILKAEITIGVRPDGVTWFAASKSTRDDTEIEGPIGETVPALIMHHKEAARIRKEGI